MPDTLSFISDADFDAAVDELVGRILRARVNASTNLIKNVRDPIPLLVEACVFGHNIETLNRNDQERSLAGGVASAVGNFHQDVLGSMPGWRRLPKGLDVVHDERRIVAEVKNKHNTMNSANKERVIERVEEFLKRQGARQGWVGYLVMIVPKTPGQNPVEIGRPNTPVFGIDGMQFYALASGVEDALQQVYSQLPERILDSMERRSTDLLDGSGSGPIAPETREFCDDLFRRAHLPTD